MEVDGKPAMGMPPHVPTVHVTGGVEVTGGSFRGCVASDIGIKNSLEGLREGGYSAVCGLL